MANQSTISGTTEEISASNGRGRRPQKGPSHFDIGSVVQTAMPQRVRPMLASPAAQPFDHPDWVFEIKWDGYRAIAEIEKGRVRLYSRKQLSFGTAYDPIVDSLKRLRHDAVLDGEVVVVDGTGKSRFQLLQNYQNSSGQLVYYVFDLLWLDGRDLRNLPLLGRKAILSELIAGLGNVRLSEHVEEQGTAFFKAAAALGLEGIVAKKKTSTYQEGRRAKCWLKIKTHLRQEAVIGGFTRPLGSRPHFGALVLGTYHGNDLLYAGCCGSGFSEECLADLYRRMQPLIQMPCAFKRKPATKTPATWLRPSLVCEVSFNEWTQDGHMRHPIFVGLRDDKPAAAVRREDPMAADILAADLKIDDNGQ